MRRSPIAVAVAVVGLTFGLAGPSYANHETVLVEPDILNFGQVVVGTDSQEMTVTFTNTGSEDVLFDGFPVSGQPEDFDGQAGGFEVVGTSCIVEEGALLPGGETCDVAFVFTPTATGQRSAEIAWETVHGLIDTTELFGEGVEPPPCSSPDGAVSGPAHGLLDPLGLGDVSRLLCSLGL